MLEETTEDFARIVKNFVKNSRKRLRTHLEVNSKCFFARMLDVVTKLEV